MGKQYKTLDDKDKEFIEKQKLFYIASSSGKEVNLSPKGYDTIRILGNDTIVFLDYPGSGNRTYTDTVNEGEFTLLFNSYEKKAMILRLFCKARVVVLDSKEFTQYLDLFKEQESLVRNFFVFKIYAIESSCGEGIPYMEYKSDRDTLKKWVIKMDASNKLKAYNKAHAVPPNLKKLY